MIELVKRFFERTKQPSSQAIQAAVLAEREACIRACENLMSPSRLPKDPGRAWITGTLDCAAAIKARGEQ